MYYTIKVITITLDNFCQQGVTGLTVFILIRYSLCNIGIKLRFIMNNLSAATL